MNGADVRVGSYRYLLNQQTLNKNAYYHLREKADGNIIAKKRYLIPIEHPTFSSDYSFQIDQISLTIELDIFDAPFENLVIAEVEFPDEEMAAAFCPVDWFDKDVTNDPAYHNSNLSRKKI